MPCALAICIEDLAPREGTPRYLRCVALIGREPGLQLDAAGTVRWREPGPAGCCELWVSGDEQLILYRPEGAAAVTVRRAGRSLAAPHAKPVVLLDGDELAIDGRTLRVHVHAPAPAVHAPEPFLPEEQRAGSAAARAAAAALAFAAALGASDCRKPVEVRPEPPAVAPTPRPDSRPAAKPDIEVRPAPPELAAPPAAKKP
jgi:hypothetical protein